MTDLRQVRPVLVLIICCASIFVVILDASIVNVALPAIGRDLAAGEHLLLMAVGTFATSYVSGWAVARFGTGPPLSAGGFAMLVSGFVLLMRDPPSTTRVLVGAGFFGIGMGLVNSPVSAMAVNGMGANTGTAAGVVSTCRQLGASVGVALAGSLSDATEGKVAPSWAMLCGCGGVVIAASAWLMLRPRAEAPPT